jgi:cytochrome P450
MTTDTRPARPGPRPTPTRDLLSALLGQAVVRLSALSGDPVARFLSIRPRQDVYAVYERIRARGPAVPSRLGVVAVTSHRLCGEILRDPRFGVRDAGGRPAGTDRMTEAAAGPLSGSFLELDPPAHTRLRRIAAPAFRPRLVRGYHDRVQAVASRLLDRLDRRRSFDLIADFATPLPIAVISDLLGIPEVDTVRFAAIGRTVGQSLDGVRSPGQARRLRAASEELGALFTRLAAERRADPRDDLISTLAAQDGEDGLTSAEFVSTCALLLIAGFETTVNLIGNGTAALLSGDRHWSALVADPSLAGRVVEETLRYDPPVQATVRFAHDDVDLPGPRPVRFPRGSLVIPVLAAANRDPSVYADPGRFDPHRTGEPDHLAFSSGIHYCLGAPLARLEGEVAFTLLAQRLPRLRAAPGRRRRPGSTIRGFRTFPVLVDG